MQKVPKIIHYVWLGKGEKPALFYKCLESWKKFCPGYEIKEWNEDNFDISDCKYAVQAYKNKKYSFVSDYIRTKVLYEYGGVYVDTDTEITKSFDDLLDNDFTISFENNVHCSTATLVSSSRHPLIKFLCLYYHMVDFINKNGKLNLTPNTILITYFLKRFYGLKLNNKKQVLQNRMDNNDDAKIMVLPKEYFSPLNYTTRKLKITSNTYAIHYFNATWFTRKMQFREKLFRAGYYILTPFIFTAFTRIWVKSEFIKLNRKNKKYKFLEKFGK